MVSSWGRRGEWKLPGTPDRKKGPLTQEAESSQEEGNPFSLPLTPGPKSTNPIFFFSTGFHLQGLKKKKFSSSLTKQSIIYFSSPNFLKNLNKHKRKMFQWRLIQATWTQGLSAFGHIIGFLTPFGWRAQASWPLATKCFNVHHPGIQTFFWKASSKHHI